MAQVRIIHGCGHERFIETPGPDDPQGLLARLASYGAPHRTPAKCAVCEPPAPGDVEVSQPSEADLDAVAAEQAAGVQTSAKPDGPDAADVPGDTAAAPVPGSPIDALDPGTPTGSNE